MGLSGHFGAPQQGQGCEEAISGVIAWTKQVLEVVKCLEWTQVGYECSQQELGKPDESKPIFKCVDPNGGHPSQLISSLLSQYSNHTMGDLHRLLQCVEQSSASEGGRLGEGAVGGFHSHTRTVRTKTNYTHHGYCTNSAPPCVVLLLCR